MRTFQLKIRSIGFWLGLLCFLACSKWKSSEPVWTDLPGPRHFFWWGPPYELKTGLLEKFKAHPDALLFIRVGTFGFRQSAVSYENQFFKANIRPIAHLQVHLVYDFSPIFGRNFPFTPLNTLVDALFNTVMRDIWAFNINDVTLLGIQFHFNCQPQNLPKYAALLKNLREKLPAPYSLSATILPAWLEKHSAQVQELIRAVDFYVPLFLRVASPQKLKEPFWIADVERLSTDLKTLNQLKRPYFAGLPLYGYCLVFDPDHRLKSILWNVSVKDLENQPQFKRLEKSRLAPDLKAANQFSRGVVEEFHEFTVLELALLNQNFIEKGSTIIVDQITPFGVLSFFKILNQNRSLYLKGGIFFKVPNRLDQLGVQDIEALLLKKSPADRPAQRR